MQEIGPQITPPSPEVVSSIEKGGRPPEKSPQVKEKYKIERIKPEEPKENIEEEVLQARKKINEEFNKKEKTAEKSKTKIENRNYYEFLGVSQDASLEEIIKAYRDLSKKTHPDIGGDAEEFKKIQKAFETLYDKDKRNQYDLGVREKRSEEPKEYQQEKPYYKQENKTSDFGKIWRGVEQVLKERYGVKENSKIEELEIIEQLKKQYYQYAVEKRWSELSNKEKQEYEVYTVVGKELKTLGENKAIENYKQKIEEKRKALSVLHLGEVSKDFFYGVLQDFWIEDSVRKNRRFRGDTINVPSRLSVTIKQMDPQQFLYWQHQVEDRIKKMFKEKAEKIIQQKNQGNK